MSPLLYSLGRWSARRRWVVLAAWLLLLALGGTAAAAFGKGLDNQVTIPGTESQIAFERLAATFPEVAGTSARIVLVPPAGDTIDDPAFAEAVAGEVDAISGLENVIAISSPFEIDGTTTVDSLGAADRSAAIVTVQIEGQASTTSAETKQGIRDAADAMRAALPDGSEVAVGGDLFSIAFPSLTATEAVGLVVALVVLVLTLGSLIAAGLPLLSAILGVGVTVAFLFAATAVAKITSTTPMLALMLGLAVGIDYALFIVSRHQELLREGVPPEEAIGRAVGTAGSAVVFAGLTVVIALVGLFVAGIPFLTVMGVAAAVGVAVAVLASLTFVPAMLGFAGLRVLRRRDRRAVVAGNAAALDAAGADAPAHAPGGAPAHAPAAPNRFFLGWVRAVTRWPVVTIVLVVVGLGALALPATSLRLALPDAAQLPESNSARVTYDLVSEHFGEGFNGPLIVTGSIIESTDPVGLMDDIGDELAALPGVAAVPLATPNRTADTGIVQVIPESGPDSVATEQLVQEIRDLHDRILDEYGVDIAVTGFTAVGIDVSARLGAALLPFALLVVGLCLVLLTIVFRSIWVPIKASLGYLLSVVAAFGVVSLVFEHGVLADLLHVERVGPVISFMPIILMGVLFGLAMDYEVFLVSRMREDYVHGGDARAAVRTGFTGAAKVVTAAALIMFSVFVAFVPEGDSNIKPIALGLAVGVFIDAFVVRMTLVPAVMQLLGERAWWLPRWLDRILPSFDVEGEALARERSLADWPSPDATAAVVADGLAVRDESGAVLFSGVALSVEPGEVLLVTGHDDRRPGTALLLAITGRLRPTEGRIKVLGRSLPERGSAVRARTAFVGLADEARPVRAVRRELAGGPEVLAIDGVDRVESRADRARIAAMLLDATVRARRAGRSITIALGGLDASAARDVVPDVAPIIVDLPPVDAGPRALAAAGSRKELLP